MINTRKILEENIKILQETKQNLCDVCNIETDREIINASHRSIDHIEIAIAKLSELF